MLPITVSASYHHFTPSERLNSYSICLDLRISSFILLIVVLSERDSFGDCIGIYPWAF